MITAMAIIMVAMVDTNYGIGDGKGNTLFGFPKYVKHFNELTANKHVVMGRKTWETLMVKPLPKRKNYVLTSDKSFKVKGRTKVLHSIDDVIKLGKHVDVYVIGGGEVYEQLLPYADIVHLTHVHFEHNRADVFFPELPPTDWKVTSMNKQEPDEFVPVSFAFTQYSRKSDKVK
jgi:dihydrofolate reductase